MRCLADRARKICTVDTLSDELKFILDSLMQNGYPAKFVEMHLGARAKLPRLPTVEKKILYLSLPFKDDKIAEVTKRRLTNAVNATYNAASLRICFTTKPMLVQQLKDKIPVLCASFCVYSFTCSCGSSYIGRTTRRLSQRVREHHPAWLGSNVQKSINSGVLAHLVDSNHVVDVTTASTPIYRVPDRYTRGVKSQMLSAAEAIAIKLFNPELCSQKQFVQSLRLPWPAIHQRIELIPD